MTRANIMRSCHRSAKPPVARPAFLPKEGPPGLPGAKGAAGVHRSERPVASVRERLWKT